MTTYLIYVRKFGAIGKFYPVKCISACLDGAINKCTALGYEVFSVHPLSKTVEYIFARNNKPLQEISK